MLYNYIKIAFRNLTKQRFYAFINILGLAISLASCLLIALFVINELSYDKFHKEAENIFKVGSSGNIGGQDYTIEFTAPPVAETLRKEFPEVKTVTRIFPLSVGEIVHHNGKDFMEEKVIAVDSNFFKIFSFKLLKGNQATVFKEPNTIVLTESLAKKYFGDQDAVGKILTAGEDKKAYEVVGVVANPPHNSQINFSMLVSISSYDVVKYFDWSWIWSGVITYVKLNPGASAEDLEAKFPKMIHTYGGNTIQRIFGMSMEDFEKKGGGLKLFLQPLTKVYLYSSGIEGAFLKRGNIQYLFIFIIVAIFIIFLACINFMNLSTAKSASRGKEVGIRKVLGTVRRNLIYQFLTESILITIVAMFIALALTQFFLSYFNSFLFENFQASLTANPTLIVLLFALILIVGIGAGSYPAFYLSAFKPVDALKGKMNLSFNGNKIRSTLVVFQFVVSVSLIICTLLVFMQLNFLRDKNLGIDQENVIVLSSGNSKQPLKQEFKNDINALSVVSANSLAEGGPGKNYSMELFIPEGQDEQNDMLINYFSVDYDFLKTFNIEVVSGRNFSREFPSDADDEKGAVLINEAAAKIFEWKDPIGKHIVGKDDGRPREIVGIVKDFNYESLHKEIAPLVIRFAPQNNFMYVRLKPGDIQASLQSVEKVWKKNNPATPFQYAFLDQALASFYHSEQRLGKIFMTFTSLAIFIACLGLFGLIAFTAEQQTKEIGIRKVLGATAANITYMLSKALIKLVIISNLVAWPIAWYMMNKWLQDFAYRIEIPWYVFVGAGSMALIIALITVSFQSVKAALVNPVESLKSE
jgi:putative ABC transport system permease protein